MRAFVAFLFQLVALHSPLSVEALRLGAPNLDLKLQRAQKHLLAVDALLWPGCLISNEYPYKADIFGFGKCSLQPCSCQEVRKTSLVWGFAAKCDRTSDQIMDFVATMRLTRKDRRHLQYPQKIDVFPTNAQEGTFAKAMRKEMEKPKWSKQPIPVFEQVGIKLGNVNISLKSLRDRAGDKCPIYDEAALMASSDKKDLMIWALPENFFSSNAMQPVSLEVRGAFPLVDLWDRLGTNLAHRTIGTVLVSLGQSFMAYEEANWVHCDRRFDHILFRKSALNRDMPSALIIDQDLVQNLALLPAKEAIKLRRRMLHWFASTVHNTCHKDRSKHLSAPYDGCDHPTKHVSEKLANEHFQKLMSIKAEEETGNDCKGSQLLAETVVGPALRCSAGDADCFTLGIAHWTMKLQAWAEEYYGDLFQEQSKVRVSG